MYSETSWKSKMELFPNTVKDIILLTIFTKSSFLDVQS